MNDFTLINELLKDGSDASILKLKMIVDFDVDDFSLFCINKNYIHDFIFLFEDVLKKPGSYLEGFLSDHKIMMLIDMKHPYIIGNLVHKKQLKILKTFKEVYSNTIRDNPAILCYICDENIMECISMFERSHLKSAFVTNAGVIAHIGDENFTKILEMFKESFKIGFLNYPEKYKKLIPKNKISIIDKILK